MRQPPAFAQDQWCWDYTREKINNNCLRKHGYELDYEDWEPKHFMAANRIYKNVVNKYGTGRSPGKLTCPKCEENYIEPTGDYLCGDCRFGTLA